ncbi:MAG: ABC transporter permease subunit [Mycobacteriales bacterium]|nr:ABC transporter permease [Frankia sp.]
MTWLAWRQFRTQALLAAGATVGALVTLIVTRDQVARVATTGQVSTSLESLRLLGTALVGVPAFIGAFWGAPMVARELEAGTQRLAWTQSITRRRWLGIKLAVASVVAIAVTIAFSAAFTWWSVPYDQLGNRIGTANFGQRGIVPVAYALFALALGTLLGAITRRTLPAVASTLLGFFVARFAFQALVRPRLMAAVVTSRPSNAFGTQEGSTAASGAWVLSSRTVDAAGRAVHDVYAGDFGRQMAQSCGITNMRGSSTEQARIACINRLGLHDIVRIHPADQFWGLQIREAAVFTLLAVILAGLAFWWIRRRVA